MSKFDRGVFIFIGLGIWALAMTQVFDSKIISVSDHNLFGNKMDFVIGECPTHSEMGFSFDLWQKLADQGTASNPDWGNCKYRLVAT